MTMTHAKAAKLLAEGRVHPTTEPIVMYLSYSDSGAIYRTFIGPTVAVCTCPATVRCKHIEAAAFYENAEPVCRLVLDQLVDEHEAMRREETRS